MQTTATPAPPPPSVPKNRRDLIRHGSPQIVASGAWERVVDIHEGGACLQGSELPNLGDHITLILTDEVLYHTTMLDAEVCWTHGRRVGVRWAGLSDADRAWLTERSQGGNRLASPGWVNWRD